LVNQQLPDERKREMLDQLRNVLRSMSENPQYRNIVNQAKQLGEEVTQTAEKSGVVEETQKKAQEIASKESERIEKIETGTREVVEAAAGPRVARAVANDFKELLNDLKSRQEFYKNYFDTLGMLLENVLQNPERLEDKEVQQQFTKLFDMGEAISEQLAKEVEQHHIKEDVQLVAKSITEHPAAKALAEDINRLKSELLSGEIIEELRECVVPYLMQQIQELPLPALAGTTHSGLLGTIDYNLDNLTLRTREIMPDKIKVKIENEFNLLPTQMRTSNEKTLLKIHVKGINASFDNVHFKYKKTSTPHVSDEGFVDGKFAGKGLRVWLHLRLLLDANRKLRIERELVKAHVDKIDIHVRDTRHSTKIYELLAGLWSSSLKDSVCTGIENTITKTLYQLEKGINLSLETAYEVREGVTNIRQHLMDGKIDEAKKDIARLNTAIQAKAGPAIESAAETLAEAINRINIEGSGTEAKPVVYLNKEREERERLGLTSI